MNTITDVCLTLADNPNVVDWRPINPATGEVAVRERVTYDGCDTTVWRRVTVTPWTE